MESIFLNEKNCLLDINELIEKLHLFSDDIVFLGGSLIEGRVNHYSKGMGNIYSDLDVFIVRSNTFFNNTHFTYSEKYKKTDFTSLNSLGIDIEIYSEEFINNLFLQINKANFAPQVRIANAIKIPEGITEYSVNSFINRFINAIPIYNVDKYKKLKMKLNLENWIKYQKYSIENSIENIFDDIQGNVHAKNYDVSVLCSRTAFLQLIKYLCFSLGDLSDREKWLPQKLNNIVKEHVEYKEILEFYNQLFFMKLETNRQKGDISMDTVSFIRRKIETISMEELL